MPYFKKQTPKNKQNEVLGQFDPKALLPTDKIIQIAKSHGVDFGPGDANERIRYFIKLGILPHVVRKSIVKDKSQRSNGASNSSLSPLTNNSTVGHLPFGVIKDLLETEALKARGLSYPQIAGRLKESREKEELTEAKTVQSPKPIVQPQSKVVLYQKVGLTEGEISKRFEEHEKKIEEKVHEEIANSIAPEKEHVELIPTEKVIEEAKNLGVDFGPGDASERIRYFIKLGILPHAIRKVRYDDPMRLGKIEGHLPAWSIKRLLYIHKLYQRGISYPQIADKIKRRIHTQPEPEPAREKTAPQDKQQEQAVSLVEYTPIPLHTPNKISSASIKYGAIFLVVFLVSSMAVGGIYFSSTIRNKNKAISGAINNSQKLGEVLAATSAQHKFYIDADTEVSGTTLFKENITAPNIIYSVKGGTGIAVTGGQNPVVSLDSDEIVTSLNDASGELTIKASGTNSISTSGSTITITGSGLASEADTLATVTGRGATTSTALTLSGLVTFGSGLTVSSGLTTLSSTGITGAGLSTTCDATTGKLVWSSSTNLFSCGTDAGASGITLQASYDASTSPEITVDSTRGALTLRDASSAIGANLFEVQNNGGTTNYFAVTSSGISTSGDLTVNGNTQIGNATTDTLSVFPTTLSFSLEAAHTIQIADSTTANTAGAALTLKGAAGVGTGNGGALLLTAGASGAGATGNGGAITLTTGAGGSTSGTAGNISLDVGTSTSSQGTIGIGTAARNQTITIGNTSNTQPITFNSGVVSGITTSSAFVFDASALTSGTGAYLTSATINTGKLVDINTGTTNTLSSGTLLNIASSSTAGTASGASYLLKLSRSGANASASHTAYGVSSSVTNSGTTATNIAGYFSASGNAATSYGILIGTTSSTSAAYGIYVGQSGVNNGTNYGIYTNSSAGSGTATNYGIRVGQTGNGTNNIAISTDSVASNSAGTTSAQLVLGAISGAGTFTTNYGITIGTISQPGTTNYGINVGAITSTGTTNYGLNIAAVSGATNNYALVTASGNISQTLTASTSEKVLISATTNTGTAGVLDIDITSATSNNRAIDLSYTSTQAGATSQYGYYGSYTNAEIVSTNVTQNHYGTYLTTAKTGADTATGHTVNVFGINSTTSLTQASGAGTGTRNTYGGYFSATGDTEGTQTAYGIYATAEASSDLEIAGYFDANDYGLWIDADVNTGTGIYLTALTGIVMPAITTGILISETMDSGDIGFSIPALSSATGISFASTGTGIGFTMPSYRITTGRILDFSGSGTSDTAFTGDVIRINPGRTASSGTLDDTGSFLDIARANTTAGASLTVSGDLATLSSSCTQSSGTCTDTSNILQLTQSYAAASGAVLNISGSGTGSAISATANAITTGTGIDLSVNGLTTGSGVNLTSTSTAGTASDSSYLLKFARSGANANTAHNAYGIYGTVTNTNATSGTNIAAYFSASGATTANYGLYVATGSTRISLDCSTGDQYVTAISTGVLACGTDNDTGAAPRLDQIIAATTTDIDNDNANNAIQWNWNSISTETAFAFASSSNSYSSGKLLNVALTQSAATGTSVTGNIASVSFNPTYSTAVTTPTISGNVLNIARAPTTNASFASTLTVSGAVLAVSDNCTQTTGTCTSSSTAHVASLTQSYAASTAAVIKVANAGTGSGIYLDMTNAAGTDGILLNVPTALTDAIDASDPEITNALNVGANNIEGTDATITFTDFQVAAEGLTTIAPDGTGVALSINLPNNTTQGIVVDASSNANTGILGVVDLNVTSLTHQNSGINLAYTSTATSTGVTQYGAYNNFIDTQNLAGTSQTFNFYSTYGLITKTGTDAHTTAGTTNAYGITGIASNTSGDTGNLGTKNTYGGYFSATGATAGTATTTFGTVAAATGGLINYGLYVPAISTAQTANYGLYIAGASGATTSYSVLVDAGDSIFDANVVIGGSTSRTETLANAGFVMGGDDLFVAGMAGFEGSLYTDGSFIAGATTTLADGSITVSGTSFDIDTATGGEIALNELGADVDVRIEGDTATSLFVADAALDAVQLTPAGTRASATSATWDAIDVKATTATITGSTAITTATGFNLINIARPTLSAGTALTVTNAATLYIANSPLGGGVGPATITNAYALWVDAGTTRLDGNLVLGGTCTGCSSTWDTIGDPAGNGAIAMGATTQTLDWGTLTTQTGLTLTGGAAQTSGTVFAVGNASTKYVHTTLNDIGSLTTLTLVDESTNANNGGTSNALNIASTINTTGAGTKSINAINIGSPTVTACTTGACTYTGLNIAAISGAILGQGISVGNISSTGANNYGLLLGTLTGGTTGNYQISTGALTSATTTTNAQLNLGGVVTTGGTSNYGINIGAISGSGTTNFGINLAAMTSTGTTNYGLLVGGASGAATTNYGIYVASVSGATNNYGIFATSSATTGSNYYFQAGATTGTGLEINGNTVTTGNALKVTGTGLAEGTLVDLSFTGTISGAGANYGLTVTPAISTVSGSLASIAQRFIGLNIATATDTGGECTPGSGEDCQVWGLKFGTGYDSDIVLQNNETISNTTDGTIDFSGKAQSEAANITAGLQSGSALRLNPIGYTDLRQLTLRNEDSRDNTATSSLQMSQGTFTGNGQDNRGITGIGFQPDLVIIVSPEKTSDIFVPMFRTSQMTADESCTFQFSANVGCASNQIQSLDADGFTVGTGYQVNLPSTVYHWVAFKDNGNDFAVGKYTAETGLCPNGTGTGDDCNITTLDGETTGTAIGFQPDFVQIREKNSTILDSFSSVYRITGQATNESYEIATAGTQANEIQDFVAGGFQIGSSGDVNEAADTYYWFAFKEVAGITDAGSYTGEGDASYDVTGPNFSPEMVWVKRNSTDLRDYYRQRTQRGSTGAETATTLLGFGANSIDGIVGFNKDGFRVGDGGSYNLNAADTYRYFAIKSPPVGGILAGTLNLDVGTLATGQAGAHFSTSSTATTGTTTYGLYNQWSSSAIVTGTNQQAFGNYNLVAKTGNDTSSATSEFYGLYSSASYTGTMTDAGTKRTFGGYFSSTGDSEGTNSSYGIYTTAGGADLNAGVYSVLTPAAAATGSYGIYSSITPATSGTAFGVYSLLSAGSGTTGYGLYVDAGAGAGTEYAGVFLNGAVGIGTATPTESRLGISVNTSSGTIAGITQNGAQTTGDIFKIIADSAIGSGFNVVSISATGLSNGNAIDITGPNDNGTFQNGNVSSIVTITSDIGNGGRLLNLAGYYDATGTTSSAYGIYQTITNAPVNFANTGGTYSLYSKITDSSAFGNTLFGNYQEIALSGNAAKTAYGQYGYVSSTSTTADSLLGADLFVDQNAASASGNKTQYGLRAQVTNDGITDGAGTHNIFGGYFSTIGNTGGTSTSYGVYTAPSGSDNNYGLTVAAISTAGTANFGAYIGNLSGAATSKGIEIGTLSSATSTGIEIGALSGNTADIGISIGAISGNGTGTGINITSLANVGTSNYGLKIGTITGASTGNFGISTGTLTSTATNNAGLNIGLMDGLALSSNNFGINIGAISTIASNGGNYGINVGTISGTNNNVYGLNIGAISAGNNKYGINIAQITSATATTSYGLNIGGFTAAAGTGTWGINIAASAATATNNYGISIGALSGAGTTNYGLYLAGASGATNNYGIYVAGGESVISVTTTQATERLCGTHTDATAGVSIIRDCNPAGQADLAEYYGSDGTLVAGEIVALDPNNQPQEVLDPSNGKNSTKAWVVKSAKTYDPGTIGIVSTNPFSEVLGEGLFANDEYPVPIALTGRVPTKVSAENGPIAAGDMITASSTAGVGMKATKVGRTIGVALESFACPEQGLSLSGTQGETLSACQGQIVVFVEPGWYLGSALANGSIETPPSAELANDPNIQLAELPIDQLGRLIRNGKMDGQILTAEQIVALIDQRVEERLSGLQAAENKPATPEASSSSALADSAEASNSAQLAQENNKALDELNKLLSTTNLSLDTLTLTGNARLAQTQVAGTFSQDGTLIIDYGRQINVLGSTLYLQNDGLAGGCDQQDQQGETLGSTQGLSLCGLLVDIGSGKAIFDRDGNLKILGSLEAKNVEVEEVTINIKEAGTSTVGSTSIEPGTTRLTIATTAIRPGAKVLITPTGPTSGKVIYVSTKNDFEGFTVAVENGPARNRIDFDWLIINSKQVLNKQGLSL